MNKEKFQDIAIHGKFYKQTCKMFDKFARKGKFTQGKPTN